MFGSRFFEVSTSENRGTIEVVDKDFVEPAKEDAGEGVGVPAVDGLCKELVVGRFLVVEVVGGALVEVVCGAGVVTLMASSAREFKDDMREVVFTETISAPPQSSGFQPLSVLNKTDPPLSDLRSPEFERALWRASKPVGFPVVTANFISRPNSPSRGMAASN